MEPATTDRNPASRADAEPRPLPSVAPGVLLWCCALERTPEQIAALERWLSPAEAARAARFGREILRHRWIAGRATLRLLLGELLGRRADRVELRRSPRGRPELADAAAPIDFNVSHTAGMALFGFACGLGPGTRIGVDIERCDRDVGADRLARKFLTAREQAALAALPPEARRQRFLRAWTCKEAMSKATGDGLAAPFRRLDVVLSEGQDPRLADGPAPYLPREWSLHTAAVPDAWHATVAIWRGAAQADGDADGAALRPSAR